MGAFHAMHNVRVAPVKNLNIVTASSLKWRLVQTLPTFYFVRFLVAACA